MKDMENARNFLQKISPNPCNSCICRQKDNECKYDLQVIIPAYKTAQYIEKCVDSVLSLPTSHNIICTVVNDGSPDNTDVVLKKYENDRRVEVVTQENRGLSGARNRALDMMKARYVTFLDSDDEFLVKDVNIDELLSFADNNKLDILECSYVTFYKKTDKMTFRHENIVSDNACGLLYGFPWGKLFRSELFSRICFPERYWFEDTVMAFVIFPMCNKVATSSTLLYHYRINPKGITSESRRNVKVLDSYWITEQLLVDREALGLYNDEDMADIMLSQIKMNYGRIKNLGNKDIDRAVFVLTANLWNKYFNGMRKSSPLVKALTDYDYLQYRLIIDLNQ